MNKITFKDFIDRARIDKRGLKNYVMYMEFIDKGVVMVIDHAPIQVVYGAVNLVLSQVNTPPDRVFLALAFSKEAVNWVPDIAVPSDFVWFLCYDRGHWASAYKGYLDGKFYKFDAKQQQHFKKASELILIQSRQAINLPDSSN